MPAQQRLQLSTKAIPKHNRLDFYMDALQKSLWQVSGWDSLPEEFFVDLKGGSLGCLTAVRNTISMHHSHRTRLDVDRSGERSAHIFVSLRQSWAFTHMGRHERLDPGDVVLIGEGEHETHAPEGFDGVIVKCPEHWIQTWLPSPELISGRCIRGDTGFGKALSLTLRQLTPDFVDAPPLPPSVVVDQIGGLLALVAGETESRTKAEFLVLLRDRIRLRCTEIGLTAEDVASSLNVSARVLHQALASISTTFATELVRGRLSVAQGLLQHQGTGGASLDEIARRSGFAAAQSLARALNRQAKN